MPPCWIDRSGLGMSNRGSKLKNSPSPSHASHIPCGLLKLKSWGESGSKLTRQWVHANSEESCSSAPEVSERCVVSRFAAAVDVLPFARASESATTIKFPLPTERASSTASASRARWRRVIFNRSITTSILWRIFRSRLCSSLRLAIRPSIRAREKPCRKRSSKRSRNSPF